MTPPPAFHVMIKPRGAMCNLACRYCFYLKKEQLYPGGSFRMSDALLEDFTRQYIEAQRVPEVTFAWQGGEPTLMGLDFFRKAVELQDKYRRPGMKVINAFQTNGILLDEAWCRFFHDHHFLVGLSIDGPRELHDTYRLDQGDQPTFARVLRAAELLQEHQVEFNTLTCVSAANVPHGLEVYAFLRDTLGSRYMQFIPIIERDNGTGYQEGARLTKRSISGSQYGRFLIDVFDEWARHDVGKVYVQMFDAALAAWSGQRAGLCIFEETCGEALAMEFNGDVYACDHFVEPRYFLGSIAAPGSIDQGSDAPFPGGAGRFRETARLRPGQARPAAALLPGVPGALRLQRRLPKGSRAGDARRRARAERALRRFSGLFQLCRPADEDHGGAAASGPRPSGDFAHPLQRPSAARAGR